jgi:tripartite-type tricarboxylate transporter receptor subunit TctC
MRLLTILLAALTGLAALPRQAAALDYPTRSVRIILPFSAGGAPDVLVRMVGQKLSEKWGQGVVIENRPGGNTLVGTVAVTKSDPDGYTLLMTGDQTFTLNPLLYDKLPYAMRELEPVAIVSSVPHMLAVSNKFPASNVKELIALAKQKPNTVLYGSTGAGSIQRIITEYFSQITGVQLVHVPYKGANETTTAILSGEINMTINGMSNILPHIATGGLKALAISTTTRSPLAPDVPTMQEAGVPGYSSKGVFGLLAPAGTPKDIQQKIADDIGEILSRPDMKKALEDRSFMVDFAGPAEFAKFIADESEKWGKVIRTANIKVD